MAIDDVLTLPYGAKGAAASQPTQDAIDLARDATNYLPFGSTGTGAAGPTPDRPATGATAGTPGTWTPAGSTPPDTLARTTGITASPATAWTVGQRVVLGDGSLAHWSGTAWVTGVA